MSMGQDVVGRVVVGRVLMGRVVLGRVVLGQVVREPENRIIHFALLLFLQTWQHSSLKKTQKNMVYM
jgi:hypothetical protein